MDTNDKLKKGSLSSFFLSNQRKYKETIMEQPIHTTQMKHNKIDIYTQPGKKRQAHIKKKDR